MQKLSIFNLVSIDGYFAGQNGDISWHTVDDEFLAIAERNANSGRTIVLGRVTYDLMHGFWNTPEGQRHAPQIAKGMNDSPKIVFSRKLQTTTWANTRLVSADPTEEIQRLKNQPGKGLVVLGSGSIVSQLASKKLIDEYEILVVPIVLGNGRTMFEGVPAPISLSLTQSRTFKNGNILHTYENFKMRHPVT